MSVAPNPAFVFYDCSRIDDASTANFRHRAYVGMMSHHTPWANDATRTNARRWRNQRDQLQAGSRNR